MPLDAAGCLCKYTTYTTLLAPHPTPPHHTTPRLLGCQIISNFNSLKEMEIGEDIVSSMAYWLLGGLLI
jgi:hypothetical protein